MFTLILPSFSQHLMHHLPYTQLRCLTNVPKHFSARRRHLQGTPSQMSTFQSVKWL